MAASRISISSTAAEAASSSYHTTAEALALRKKMSELAKKNRYPHRLGSSGYAGHVDQWRETEQRFAAAGKPLLVDPMVERSKNWVWARSTGQVSDEGDILFETPDIEQVTTNLQQIVEKERAGQFVPRRERDQLTVALGTAEHSGRVRGLSSKPSWKIGFPHDAPSYKKRDKYKEQLSYKIYAQVKEHFYSLVAKNPTAFPRLFPDGQQPTQSTQQTTNAPSSVGSVETTPFPMDGITGPTPCSLVVPIGRARKTKEVATGLAIPGCQLHNTAIPEDYARVQVAKVHRDHISLELDIPAPERIELLGDAVNQFMLWHRRDIILTAAVPAAGSSTPSSSQARTVAASASPSPPGPPSPPNLASPLPFRSPPRQPTPPPLRSSPHQPTPPPSHSQQPALPAPQPVQASPTSPAQQHAPPTPPLVQASPPTPQSALVEQVHIPEAFRNSEKRKELAHVMSDSQKSVLAAQDELQSWLSADVPETYEYGKPFLPTYLMNNLPWEMRAMHEWYIKAYRKGLGFISIAVPEDLYALYKLDKMDYAIHEADRTGSPVGYIDPTRICKRQHTVELREDYEQIGWQDPSRKGRICEAIAQQEEARSSNILSNSNVGARRQRCLNGPLRVDIPEIPYIAQQINNGTTWNVGADLCRFLRRDVCNARGLFYDNKNELAMNDKFKPLREWEKEHMQ
ncbi:Os01g0343900 [Oryza sativa Japonica Group]|uniref:Os01g0343900 protein n=1 Tax=Oryza sativa subsp. japonica TaxID=39947 RepID=Q0JN03_ORYSJ|nr:Os01g0343900 [Oryza sativa Japonica Group]|eukprot:NP_001042961.2 Os01g0343900 [Oryza sativa Japonica Group]